MRRLLLVLLVSVLGLDVLALAGEIGPNQEVAEASVAAASLVPPVQETTTTTTTTVPPTTTTTAPPPPQSRPVDVPPDPYAREEVRVIGTIEVPKLGLRVPLQQGVTLNNIDRGPSHWTGSALPGQAGNVVVMGHRVTKTKPFRHIDTLVPGDEVFFEVDGVRTRYVMTHSEVVTPDRTDIAAQTAEPIATLFACHPPGSAKYRYVVRLKLA
jgi:sortase A